MPYGKEAKEELRKLVEGKCLRVLVYGEDRYNRCVGDLYCNGKFIQVTLITLFQLSTMDHMASCFWLCKNKFLVLSTGSNAEKGLCVALHCL